MPALLKVVDIYLTASQLGKYPTTHHSSPFQWITVNYIGEVEKEWGVARMGVTFTLIY